MADFLVVLFSDSSRDEGDCWFRSGLETAQRVGSLAPSGTFEGPRARAASFARRNGTGTPIVTDLRSGNWLLAVGTWFHRDGYAVGDESSLLSRYLEVGALDLGRELEGFFNIVIGDARTRDTFVLTDPMGSCHSYVRPGKNLTAISGSSLLLAALGDCTLNLVGVQEFLSTGTIYEDRTVYREVHKLRCATVFRFADGILKDQHYYWRISQIDPEALNGQRAVDALAGSLIAAARRIGRTFSRPVCDLTGGYDSRAVAGAFLTAGVPFATTVSGPVDSPDVVISQRLAQCLGLPHLHVPSEEFTSFREAARALPFTDGEFELFEYAKILSVHSALSQHFDISINGSYGGIARALWWELLFPRIGARRPLDAPKLARGRYASHRFDASLFPPPARLDLVRHFTEIIERTNDGLSGLPNTTQMDYANLSLRIQRWQGRIASSTDRLWPCVSLFGLRSVLEIVLQVSAPQRLRSLLIRRFLAQYQPRLARVPLDRGYPALPANWLTFHRFWPVPAYYWRRLVTKLRGLRSTASRPPSAQAIQRLHLWREEDVQEVLDPTTMRLCSCLDQTALADFLQRSREPRFPFHDQWMRLLTLEYTLRVVESYQRPGLTTRLPQRAPYYLGSHD